ncbi:MAG: hypothetical protein KC620_08480 [Myxococcales bacterium]|nr:hypothetical protein [Myxococcales bacterium]
MLRLRSALTLCAPLLLLACADAAGSGDGDPDMLPRDSGRPPFIIPQTDMGDPMMTPDEPRPGELRNLAIIGDRDHFVLLGSTLELQVIYSAAEAEGSPYIPVANARVTFKLYDENGAESPGGVAGSVLRSAGSQTDEQGVATAEVRISNDEESWFQVEASAPGAEPVRFSVTVGREGVGALNVRIVYEPERSRYTFRELDEAEVFLFDNQNCGQIAQEPTNIFGAYLSVPRNPFDSVDNLVNIRDLEDGQRFTVAAVAYNLRQNTVAFGCAEAVPIVGGRTTSVDVPLEDLPLEFKGRFRVVHRFDLTDMLRSSDNDTLNTVADILDILRILGSDDGERGRAIISLFCDFTGIDPGICDIVEPIAGALIDRVIDGVLAEQAPQVLAVLRGISDVLTILTDMTVVGEMEFFDSGVDEEGWIRENESRWQKFRFRWRNGCPPGTDCVQEFTIGELHNEAGMGSRPRPIYGNFDGQLVGARLYIPEHTYTVRYASILLGLAEMWIIPAILGEPGPVGIDEVLEAILPCEDIDRVIGEGNCQFILVEGLSQVIYEQLGRLEFASDAFTISGSVEPVDDDGDLVVDRLVDGVWSGMIGEELAFPGCFSGCRGLDCEPEECLMPERQ